LISLLSRVHHGIAKVGPIPAPKAALSDMDFRVQLDAFSGPLDLLLYLVRKHELDIIDIPVARVADQYLEFVDVLEQIDVDTVADFLDLASALIEIKSRMVLPRPEEIDEPEIEDPREELVVRLLEFKKYRDAAQLLESRNRDWQERYTRRVPCGSGVPASQPRPVEGVELWDLVSAFSRVIRHKLVAPQVDTIRYDDTPIQIFMQRIAARIRDSGRVEFGDLFAEAALKSTLIGMFLAVLELMRHGHAAAEQCERFGPIWLTPGSVPLPIDSAMQVTADQS
jgi:segregation and condensation protein A